MPARPSDIDARARCAAFDVARDQWTTLSASGGDTEAGETAIDPKALVLISAQLVEPERRPGDFVTHKSGS